MEEVLEQIRSTLRGMWQRRWFGMIVAWVIALVGIVVVMRMSDRYEVSARVFVDTQSVLKPLLSGLAVQPDVDQQVAMLARTLITRPNLEQLVDRAGAELQIADGERDRFIDGVTRNIRFTSAAGRENLFSISYVDTDPERARRLVSNLVALFMQSGRGGDKRDADEAARVINEQIKVYEDRLIEAENRLKDFKLKNAAFIGNVNQDYFARTSAASEDVAKLRTELRAAEQSRDAIKRELGGEDPVLLPAAPAATAYSSAELDARIDSARKQLDELERRYTDQHPDVVSTRNLVTTLEAQRKREFEARRKAASGSKLSAATNPVFQQLKISLTEAEANVASLRSRLGDAQERLSQLRGAAGRVPQVEAEMVQLNRDYDVLRKQYQELVGRRETANLSSNVDATARLAEFRLIDPPRVAPRPVFPNRSALLSLSLLLAIAAGLAAAFAASQITPVVHGVRELRALTQRPVLGHVSLRLSPEMLRVQRYGKVAFASAATALLVSHGVCLTWIGLGSASL
jgi:polysaccharide chain length determinant protein (PEP-CTERM system associated)